MASKNVEKLAQRLKDEFGIMVNPETFQRSYAGIHMRNAGAFIWYFIPNYKDDYYNGIVGGRWPLSDYVIKKNKLEIQKDRFGEIEVYVLTPEEQKRS